MAISDDLFIALLAMDAYNRKSDIDDTAGMTVDGQIGQASVLDIALPTGYNTVGFHATAYNLNGETIIAFRGTDTGENGPALNDIAAGWLSGAGTWAPQTAMAEEFYEAVTGLDLFQTASNVTLTGHSASAL